LVKGPNQAWDIRGAVIKSASDFAALSRVLRTPYVESFRIAFLNDANQVVHSQVLTVGGLAQTLVERRSNGRELARIAKAHNATRVISSHNHPSGDPGPSSADVRTIRAVSEALEFVGLKHIDHVITDGNGAWLIQHGSYKVVVSKRKNKGNGVITLHKELK
jgi:DNA repair protein RadC